MVTLVSRFGKSEHYIRIRLKMNNLIPELTDLLDREIINISVAFELSKYSVEIQLELYERSFMHEKTYNGWKRLTAKEIASRIERGYYNSVRGVFL